MTHPISYLFIYVLVNKRDFVSRTIHTFLYIFVLNETPLWTFQERFIFFWWFCNVRVNLISILFNAMIQQQKNLILFYFIRTLIFFLCVFHVQFFCLTPVCAMIREWKKCSNKYGLLQGGAGISFFLWYFYICTIPHTIFSVLSGSSCFTTERTAKNKYFTKFFTIFFFQLYVSSSHDSVRYWRIYYFIIEFYTQKSFVTVGEENIPEKDENSLFRHCWMKQFGWRRTFNEGIFVWICTCVNISQSLLNNMHPNMCHPRACVCMY